MDNSFSSLVDPATSVLIVLPTKPYFDQVAAGLSLYLSLRDKKETQIVSSSPVTVPFNRLIGVNKIVQEVGNKNLTIKFAGYDAANIEKVSYDIEEGEFKLTVVPKAGFSSPQKEQIDLSYSGVSSDLLILIGGANETHFPLVGNPDLAGAKIVHIGTRALTGNLTPLSFAKPGSSVSELIAKLIKENELPMDSDTATNLIMGIEEGSNNFASPEVTPETFEVFAHLLRSGGLRQPKVKLSPADFPPGAIPAQPFTPQPRTQIPQDAMPAPEDAQGTQETEQVINPPDDWLQPKVYKGTSEV